MYKQTFRYLIGILSTYFLRPRNSIKRSPVTLELVPHNHLYLSSILIHALIVGLFY